ncbi:hypothetical protein IWQ62_004282 [Dispira parvispora]|uniref:Peptidase S28 n=1 Tax=Dispira parvispora TaxID=1520584 RepID=A0A9W8AS61_9FUNG|nr:hypothetical protein IWQ62_004282 [Dispira parvispora]
MSQWYYLVLGFIVWNGLLLSWLPQLEAQPLAARLAEDSIGRLDDFFDIGNTPLNALVETELWFPQRVDHMDDTNEETFPQLYYLNDTYYQPGGPVYLYTPGEAPNRPRTVTRGFLLKLAEETQGLVISLEHRYYGRSNPVPDLSPQNMRFLSVAQALRDFVNFMHKVPLPQIADRENIRWIIVGGSYAGNLAAWMRLKYPDLVFAAYSSSAPVRAKRDFYEYDLAVGDRLPCHLQISEALDEVDRVLDEGDQTAIRDLQAQFGLEALERPGDFAGALVDQMAGLVQYYAPPRSGKPDNVVEFCNYFFNHTQPVDGFAAATRQYLANDKIDVIEKYDTYQGANNYTLGQAGRAWFYQTCTEFAYWQTAPPPAFLRARSQWVDLDYNEAPCRAYFGDQLPLPVNVESLNWEYNSDHISVDRVYFVNGEFDPWRRLSVSSPVSPHRPSTEDTPVQIINGASHCYDLRQPNEDTDWPQLLAVRDDAIDAFKRWLKTPSE